VNLKVVHVNIINTTEEKYQNEQKVTVLKMNKVDVS